MFGSLLPALARRTLAGTIPVVEALEARQLLDGTLGFDVDPGAAVAIVDGPISAVTKAAGSTKAVVTTVKAAKAKINAPKVVIAADFAEPNDTRNRAYNLGAVRGAQTWSGLTLHRKGNSDFYTFQTTTTGGPDDVVSLAFSNGEGNIELRLFSTTGKELRSSLGTSDGESIALEGMAPGTYVVRVYGYNGATNPNYSLTIRNDGPTASVVPSPREVAEWSVLVYMDGDCDLEYVAVGDINEMESVDLPDDVYVTTLFDRITGYARTSPDWSDTRRGRIGYDGGSNRIASRLSSVGEKNMGNAGTLSDYIAWATANYPAENYALIIWNHGGGLDGACWDDSSGTDHLTVAELTDAVAASNVHFDMIGFDVCFGAMAEQLYDLAPYADVIVGSEEVEPGDGWDYEAVLGALAADPQISARDLATVVVDSYGAFYGSSVTMSAIDTTAIPALATALDTFANAVANTATNNDWTVITSARREGAYFTYDEYRDLGNFMAEIATNAPTAAIRQAAQDVAAAVDNAVFANFTDSYYNSTGIAIYLPQPSFIYYTNYTGEHFDLLAATAWDDFTQLLFARPSTGANYWTIGDGERGPAERSVSALAATTTKLALSVVG